MWLSTNRSKCILHFALFDRLKSHSNPPQHNLLGNSQSTQNKSLVKQWYLVPEGRLSHSTSARRFHIFFLEQIPPSHPPFALRVLNPNIPNPFKLCTLRPKRDIGHKPWNSFGHLLYPVSKVQQQHKRTEEITFTQQCSSMSWHLTSLGYGCFWP